MLRKMEDTASLLLKCFMMHILYLRSESIEADSLKTTLYELSYWAELRQCNIKRNPTIIETLATTGVLLS